VNDGNDNTVQRWRPWQFSLRTLMILMLVVAAFFAGWHARDWQARNKPKLQWMDEMGTVFTVEEDGTTRVEPKSGPSEAF
jgi:hypothetical protein